MRDPLSQAWGLQGAAAWQQVQVCAIVDSDTAPGSELLWPLSAQLQQFGYPVLVLDGCQTETATAPGLRDLLAEPAWQVVGLGPRPSQASVATLPAALGLGQLRSLQPLQSYARRYAVVIVHASVEVLAPLLQGRPLWALLPLDLQPQGMVRNYQQLKHLAVQAGVCCILADTTRAHEDFARRHARSQMASLVRCAQRHLDMTPLCTQADPLNAADMRHLALQWLTHAAPLAQHPVAALDIAAPSAAPTAVRGILPISDRAWSQ